jgi:predicted nucleotidyltransferase
MRELAEIRLQARDRAAIEEAATLLRRRFPVVRIILFGSKARGDDDGESDIDLLILTSRPLSREDRHAITDALFPVQLRHDVVLSVLIVPAEEWDGGIVSVLPIRGEIVEQGVAA